MSEKADRLLAIVFAMLIVALLFAFFTNEAFFDWAFERHRNTASWIARPLLVLPFCYFAWRRSLAGVMASVLAILSSMFWFPPPAEPNAEVTEFLAMERSLLSQGWTAQTAFGAVAVIAYCIALAAAFWKRSWVLGLIVAAAGALLKMLWSVLFSPEAGSAVFPFALGGLAVLVVVVLAIRRFASRRG
jgi:hypothetical protein